MAGEEYSYSKKIFSFNPACSRCRHDYGERGPIVMWYCLGCNDAVCPTCAAPGEAKNGTCQACQDDPTRWLAYKAE